nr:class I SAM-dependent methyltransferase [uncultured Methanospirillum sp.]
MAKASDIDWNELWRIQLTESFNNRNSDRKTDCSCYWDTVESARNYQKTYGIHPDDTSGRIKQIQSLPLSSDSTILEIGAGPGVLTIPIAANVKHITAIEPAKGMFQVLKERAQAQNLNNITLIHKKWEDIETDSIPNDFDLVIASFSLGMPDIREAVLKMSGVCKGEVIIFWHADIPQFEELYSMVWPSLYGREYIVGPKSDLLFNVLYQMKIYPSVEFFEYYQHQSFSSFQDLQDYFRYQHCLECDLDNEVFKAYLDRYVTETDGEFIHHERLPCMMFRWPGDTNLMKNNSKNQHFGV